MRADALKNRRKVLEVAEHLFATKGLEAEMTEIAAAAGVGVGTVYRHFATKDALLRAIIVGPIEELIERAAALGAAPDPGTAFFALFEELVVLANLKHGLVEALAKRSHASFGTPGEIESRHRRFRAAFTALLERAQAAGAVRRNVEAAELIAIVNGAFPYLRRQGGTRKDQARLYALVVDALRPPPAPRG